MSSQELGEIIKLRCSLSTVLGYAEQCAKYQTPDRAHFVFLANEAARSLDKPLPFVDSPTAETVGKQPWDGKTGDLG